MNLGSSINLKNLWEYIAITCILAQNSDAHQLKDIIEPDVIDDFINDVDITQKSDKGAANKLTKHTIIVAKNDNEKDLNVTGHEQVSIGESGMDNTTSDDPDSIKIQEQPETPQQDKQELADKQGTAENATN